MRLRWFAIVAAAIVVGIVAVPYYSWVNYEAEVAVYEEPTWEYPFDRGFEFSISWTATTTPKADYPYLIGSCDLTVSEQYFDVLNWNPEDGPESVSFWDYLADYYAGDTASVVPEDSLFAVQMTCLFERPDGTKEWIPIGESSTIRWYGYETAGTYSDDFVLYSRGWTGTYTFSMAVLVEGSPGIWNTTIAWDKVVISVVNPWEQ